MLEASGVQGSSHRAKPETLALPKGWTWGSLWWFSVVPNIFPNKNVCPLIPLGNAGYSSCRYVLRMLRTQRQGLLHVGLQYRGSDPRARPIQLLNFGAQVAQVCTE